MSAGFICRTEDGVVQVSDTDVHFNLFEKGVLPSTGWTLESDTSGAGYAFQYNLTITGYSLSDSPMLAISSKRGTWHSLLSSTSNSLTFRIYRLVQGDPDDTVRWFLFSRKVIPPHSGSPIKIRNANGDIVFSGSYPPARILGKLDQNGYSGLPVAGRLCAHVPVKQGVSSFRTIFSGQYGSCSSPAGPGYQVYESRLSTRTSIIAADSLAITGPNRGINIQGIALYCSPGMVNQNNYSVSGGFMSLILDVTNY